MDRLCFYSRSKDAAPGKGAREVVRDPNQYQVLQGIPHWRRVLSNFHAGADFELWGLHWRTIEHAFQAAKMRLVDPAKYFAFSVESQTPDLGLARDGLAARRMRKWAVLPPDKLAEWNSGLSAAVMRDAAAAKYAADKDARTVLAATGNAELWHLVPRGQPVRFRHLEEVRAVI